MSSVENTNKNKKDKVEELIDSILKRNQLIESETKKLNADTKKLIKSISKKHTKSKQTSENLSKKKPSGFAKPTLLSEELCKFLNKEVGTEMARTQVTKQINDYIKNNNLQNKEQKQFIDPDEKLKQLLKIENSFTYFELQKHMIHLFPK
jgi:chromatin remodeling complex protein RSC6